MKAAFVSSALAGDPEPVNTTTFDCGDGRVWTLNCDYNTFALSGLSSGDAGALRAFIKSMVVEDQWDDFNAFLSEQRGLDATKLMQLVTDMIEATSARPTKPPSGSGVTASKRTSSQTSKGGSTVRRGNR